MGELRSKTVSHGVLGAIGNTPLVQLLRLPPAGSADLFVKLEYLNPSGSVKDRVALAVIEDAEERGLLSTGGTILEPSGGNMGLALALVGAAKGYKVVLVMPADVPEEHRRRLLYYGAEVVQSPATQGMAGAVAAAKRLMEEHSDYYLIDQFSSPAGVHAHRQTTAREVLGAMDRPVDTLVVGVGTGATITGVGEVLKAENPSTLIVAVEPSTSPTLSQGKPGPHRIAGLGPDFVPALLNRQILDEILLVSSADAYKMAGSLASQEGLFVGPSSGANVTAALQVAARLGEGRTVLTVLADGAERYLRTA